ncbi:MAG TPA: hypothetical protein VLB27_06700, partial [candidate division Zixibacteria bacterium]|nr:hypothetical protein [candidate division Zixibacteria bacterium]
MLLRNVHSAIRLLAALSLCVSASVAQTMGQTEPARPNVEEIVIGFEVQRLLNEDIFAQYDGHTVYVPLLTTFRLLEMHISAEFDRGRFHGYLGARNEKFDLNFADSKVRSPYVDRHLTSAEYIATDIDLYLRVDLYQEFFGLP